jgi:hypothetical protein
MIDIRSLPASIKFSYRLRMYRHFLEMLRAVTIEQYQVLTRFNEQI